MRIRLRRLCTILTPVLLACYGCAAREAVQLGGDDLVYYQDRALQIEYPDVGAPEIPESLPPFTIENNKPKQYWDMRLEDAVQIALANSRVLLDLGGTVVRAPDAAQTVYGPSITETDPQLGVDAALSAFDADFSTSFFYDKNDRRVNNTFVGDLGFFQQDLGVFEAAISKQAATGSRFTVRKNVEYDRNNAIGNEFPDGAWTVNLDAEFRQPLLQGNGTTFNRIAGPGAQPGLYNGVLIARIRTDISLAEFEAGVRDFVSDVENAYWDLYFAYRDLDAKVQARDAALETWRSIHALYLTGRKGGEAQNEAQAREQYYRFEEEVQNALSGRLLEGTRNRNGSPAGSFRGTGGVHLTERRLRLLMGLPVNDGRLIRPANEPPTAQIVFDWDQITTESLTRRVELRAQQWQIKRQELELIASRNFLKPTLDAVGRYRWRGFGDSLLDPDRAGPRFDNAYKDLTTGDFQEWQLGLEFEMPIGFRQAHAAVRNAEFRLTRARAVLEQQERSVLTEVGNAVANLDRAFAVVQTTYNRREAGRQRLDAMLAAYKDDITTEQLFLVLDAQRRFAESQSQFYAAQVEYSLALKNVHYTKGTLLPYVGVALTESPWPAKAGIDASELEARRGRPKRIDYRLPPITAEGPSVTFTNVRPLPSASDQSVVPSLVPAAPAQITQVKATPARVTPAGFGAPLTPAPAQSNLTVQANRITPPANPVTPTPSVTAPMSVAAPLIEMQPAPGTRAATQPARVKLPALQAAPVAPLSTQPEPVARFKLLPTQPAEVPAQVPTAMPKTLVGMLPRQHTPVIRPVPAPESSKDPAPLAPEPPMAPGLPFK